MTRDEDNDDALPGERVDVVERGGRAREGRLTCEIGKNITLETDFSPRLLLLGEVGSDRVRCAARRRGRGVLRQSQAPPQARLGEPLSCGYRSAIPNAGKCARSTTH